MKAHIGAVFWKNESTYLRGDMSNLSSERVSDKGVSLLSGIGIGYGISRSFAVFLDFEKTEIADIKTQNIGLSLLIRL